MFQDVCSVPDSTSLLPFAGKATKTVVCGALRYASCRLDDSFSDSTGETIARDLSDFTV